MGRNRSNGASLPPRLVPPTQKLMYVTVYELIEWMRWYQFCELRGLDVFAIHKRKIKECRKFRLSSIEIKKLGLVKEVRQ